MFLRHAANCHNCKMPEAVPRFSKGARVGLLGPNLLPCQKGAGVIDSWLSNLGMYKVSMCDGSGWWCVYPQYLFPRTPVLERRHGFMDMTTSTRFRADNDDTDGGATTEEDCDH